MPDSKISALADGGAALIGDQFVVARSGSNVKLSRAELQSVFNVKDYGAKGDNVADDTAAIQSALTAAKAGSGVCYLPEGTYRVTSQLSVEGCKMLGSGVEARTTSPSSASTLRITDTVNPAIALKAGGSVEGVAFYYPNQVTTATPTVYPATIKCLAGVSSNARYRMAEVRRCLFINSYIAIDTSSAATDALWLRIENNDICAISVGINYPYSQIETLIHDNRFTYAFWDEAAGQPIVNTINLNATAIQIGSATTTGQGAHIANNTIFGFNKGIAFLGTASITTIANNMIDGCCYGIDFSGLVTQVGEVSITGGVIGSNDQSTPQRIGYGIGASWTQTIGFTFITISGVTFEPGHGDQVSFTSTNGSVNAHIAVTGCVIGPARKDQTAVAGFGVFVSGAGLALTVSGCQFTDPKNQAAGKMVGVHFDSGVTCAVTGNSFQWMSKSVDVSGMTSGAHGTVTGNVAFVTNTQDLYYPSGDGIVTIAGNRWSKGQGGIDEATSGAYTVASAATVTLPDSGDFIIVNGTTTITSLAASWWGRCVKLVFTGALTLTDGSNLRLAGNFVTTSDDTITLTCLGGVWYEASRSVN